MKTVGKVFKDKKQVYKEPEKLESKKEPETKKE